MFNVLMANVTKLVLPRSAKIFIFIDDITVVISGRNQLVALQEALDITEECHHLGLKINPNKTQAMAVKNVDLGGHLSLEQQRTEWVKEHQCLGVWLDSPFTSR